jgi:hypothetical protein
MFLLVHFVVSVKSVVDAYYQYVVVLAGFAASPQVAWNIASVWLPDPAE